ncbi:MAG TPA: hypothetical protein VNC50_03575 [Planctomycetia bacterium]|nr:hypothetical protein [Planctomycetia bacterium]
MSKQKRTMREKEAPPHVGTGFGIALAGVALAAAALAAGGAAAVDWLRGEAVSIPILQTAVSESDLPSPPPWIRHDVAEKRLAEPLLLSRADPEAPRRLSEAFSKSTAWSSWIRRVEVRRTGNGFAVELDYRKPVVAIPWRTEFAGIFLAEDGTVLFAQAAREDALRACLTLDGLAETEIPPVGKPFPDSRAVTLARLGALLAPHRAELRLARIAITSSSDAPLEVELKTVGGSSVRWIAGGRLPDPQTERRMLDELKGLVEPRRGLDVEAGPGWYDATVSPIAVRRLKNA